MAAAQLKRYECSGRASTALPYWSSPLHTASATWSPGGLAAEITAAQAARIIEQAEPAQAVGRARRDLAAELLADLRHLDAQLAGVADQAHASWAR